MDPRRHPSYQDFGLMLVAQIIGIAYQLAPSGKPGSNDSKPMQVARGGIAVAGVGIPQRNMHTQAEVCELRDIENSIELLVEFVRSIRRDTDFSPIDHRR
jgi:endoglucanase